MVSWFLSFCLLAASPASQFQLNPDSILSAHYTKTLNDSVFVAGDIIRLPEIRFDLSGHKSFVDSDSSFLIIRDFLHRNPLLLVKLLVHTDTRGTPDVNQRLSLSRARFVCEYLVETFGSDTLFAERLVPTGKGESIPLVSEELINQNKTDQVLFEKLHQLNRRMEFEVIGFLGKNYYLNQRASNRRTESYREPVSYDDLVMIADRALLEGDYEKALRYYGLAADIAPVQETFAKEQRNKLLVLKQGR